MSMVSNREVPQAGNLVYCSIYM